MEKDKLDEFFNQKLPGRSFEPTEEYWKQAEALIEAQEKKRRNWKFLWWGLGIFLLLGFAIGWNWQSNRFAENTEGKTTSEVLKEPSNSISTEVEQNKTNKNFTEKEALNNTKEKSNTDASETNSKVGESSFATAEKNNNNTGSSDQLVSSNASTTNQPKTKTAATKNTKQLSLKNNKVENGNIINAEIETIKNENKISELKDLNLNNDKNIVNNSPNIENKSGQQYQLPISEKDTAESKDEKDTEESKDEKDLATSFLMETLNLESLLFSMDELDRELDLGKATPYESEYPQPRRKNFNLGIQGGVSLFPAKGNEKFLNGWEGGLTAQYQLSRNWLIGADLLYLKNIGTFNQSDLEVSELNYSFGSKKTTYDFRRTSLSTAEVPLYVQYKMDKHRLEAGLSLNFLLGVRGALEKTETLFPWERENLETPTQTTITETKWVSKDGFKTFYPSLILGYRFEMTKRFDMGVRARYVWAKNDVIDGDNGIVGIYQEFQPLSFRVNLRYYLIK